MGSGDHPGHLLADEPDVILGEDVPVLHVHPEVVREVAPGDHLDHTGSRLCLRCVDRENPRIGVRALDHCSVEKVRTEVEVVHELGRTADLVEAVDPNRRLADATQPAGGRTGFEGEGRGHRGPPFDVVPAARTASMMGS